MAINLRELKKQAAVEPPRMLIYGPPGYGKTSLASEFPNAIFIQTEDGTPGDREIAKFPKCLSYDDVVEAIGQLANDEHDFTTVVLDSLDKLEPLLWDKVAKDNKWNTGIEEPGYGKGYVAADAYWRYIMEGFENLRITRGMTIVYIAHSNIERFDSPTTAAYNRYDIRLHKRALAIIQDDVDAILFVNQDTSIKTDKGAFGKESNRADGGGTLWIHAQGRPAFTAKNRYGMPARIMFKEFEGYAELAPYLPAQAPEFANNNEPAPVAEKPRPAARPAKEQTVNEEYHGDPTAGDEGYVPPGDEPAQESPRKGGRRAA